MWKKWKKKKIPNTISGRKREIKKWKMETSGDTAGGIVVGFAIERPAAENGAKREIKKEKNKNKKGVEEIKSVIP